jgi:tartrate dehydrogenase/decarboxylase/D-malate dehydrogenase
MPFWDEIVAERVAAYPALELTSEHIDALAAKLVLAPARFDVIVASNLFGDILSDLAAARRQHRDGAGRQNQPRA